ncbi:hypothetical protein HGRIS_002317 [Hohenbuehelia grisea]
MTLPTEEDLMQDSDPSDQLVDGPELGLLLRTDFSDEEAWKSFISRLEGAEAELAEALKPEPQAEPHGEAEVKNADDAMDEDSDSEDDEPAAVPSPVLRVVNPDAPEERSVVSGISNLTALRLFNDIDIRPAPPLPPDSKRVLSPNPLIDYFGWQEIYSGPSLWIYDAKSNQDQCLRQVSQQGDVYGTATGDSWRTRVTHAPELQFNMTCLGMKIDFGGLDRWDYEERKRNLDETIIPM